MLCGYRSYSAIAEWGLIYGARIAHALGFTHNTPCAATLHTVFRHVDRDAVEATWGAWAEKSLSAHPRPHRRAQPPWRLMAKRCEARASKARRESTCCRACLTTWA